MSKPKHNLTPTKRRRRTTNIICDHETLNQQTPQPLAAPYVGHDLTAGDVVCVPIGVLLWDEFDRVRAHPPCQSAAWADIEDHRSADFDPFVN